MAERITDGPVYISEENPDGMSGLLLIFYKGSKSRSICPMYTGPAITDGT